MGDPGADPSGGRGEAQLAAPASWISSEPISPASEGWGGAARAAPAGVGRRAAAIVIDGLLSLPLLVLLFARFGQETSQVWTSESGAVRVERGWYLDGPPFLFFLLVWLVYFIVMEARFRATVGKLAMGLRVELVDGSPLTVGAVLIRNALRIIDGLFFYLVGAIFAWTSPLRQRLGDRAAGTVVVHRRE